jgi:hypothetical protein
LPHSDRLYGPCRRIPQRKERIWNVGTRRCCNRTGKGALRNLRGGLNGGKGACNQRQEYEEESPTSSPFRPRKKCFPVLVETSLGQSSAANSLPSKMIVRNIAEVIVQFRYADGKKPTRRRYTTVGKLERNVAVSGGISGVFVEQKIDWLRWRD